MLRPIRKGLATLGVLGLTTFGASFGVALPAHAEGDATDDTVQTTEAPKVTEPASPPAPKPAPDPDPSAEVVKEVVADDSEADAAAAKLAADKAAAEAAEAKAKAEAEAAKAAADKAADDAAAAKAATDTEEVLDPPAEEVVVEEPEPEPEPDSPAEPATTSSATACVFSDALIRVTVTTGDDKDHVGDVDVDGTQVSPETGGKVPGVFFVDNQSQDSVQVRVTAKDAPFSGIVNVASSCSGSSGDNGGDPDDGGGDPDPEPAGPLPESVDDVDVSTTVNEQITFKDDASWGHLDDVFKCEPNNGQVFDAWGVNPEVYYLPDNGFTGVDEFTCTVTRGDKSLTWNVKVTVTEPDADDDGTPDGDDAFPNDPKESKDSDEDGVGDNADAFPRDPKETKDSDEDGVGDNADKCESTPVGESVDVNGCSASQRDGDRDGLTDAEEAELGTDPAKADTDGDGYSDRTEVDKGTNPLDPNSHPGDVRPPQPEAIFTQKTVEDKSCKKGLRTQLQDFVSDPAWVNGAWVLGEPVLLESGPWIKVRSLTKSEKAELKCSVDKDKDADKGKEPNTGPQSKTGDLPDEDDGDDPGLTQYVVAVVQGAVVFLALGAVMLVFSLRRKEQEAI